MEPNGSKPSETRLCVGRHRADLRTPVAVVDDVRPWRCRSEQSLIGPSRDKDESASLLSDYLARVQTLDCSKADIHFKAPRLALQSRVFLSVVGDSRVLASWHLQLYVSV